LIPALKMAGDTNYLHPAAVSWPDGAGQQGAVAVGLHIGSSQGIRIRQGRTLAYANDA
jgi:hypothetical protein